MDFFKLKQAFKVSLSKLLMPMIGLGLLSCSAGKITSEWVILPIEEGQSYSETYRDIDYTMVVNCHYKPGGSEGAGTLEFKGEMTPNRKLDTLIINLNFLDPQGKRLQTYQLYNSGIGRGAGSATITSAGFSRKTWRRTA